MSTPHQFYKNGQGDGLSTGKAYSAPAVARQFSRSTNLLVSLILFKCKIDAGQTPR
jgi:hypothetical protein